MARVSACSDTPKRILIVDDEPVNLHLFRQILKDRYQLLFAGDGEEAIGAATEHKPDLILLDVEMPNFNGFDVCQHLKQDNETRSIPIIFVTARREEQDEAKGFDVGAVDYIHKPISGPIVLRRINTQLSLVAAKELESSQRSAIQMLGEAGHYHDSDTGIHIWRMAAYARTLAEALGWPSSEASILELAAPMHDTGKIGIPDTILRAPRALTAKEWEIMKRHTQIGFEILSKSDSPIFRVAAEVALCHHERWDGTGYPIGLSEDYIPESARIVAIADVFDALTTKRPYKEPWDVERAFGEILGAAGSHFDPAFIKRFMEIRGRILEVKKMWDQIEAKQKEMRPDPLHWLSTNNQKTG